jgi:hypothetical protein
VCARVSVCVNYSKHNTYTINRSIKDTFAEDESVRNAFVMVSQDEGELLHVQADKVLLAKFITYIHLL